MKSTKNFRNSNDELYSDESKKNKKNSLGHKGNSQKKRFIEEIDDDEDIDFDYKEHESIEDYFDDDYDDF
jgi:hypothetical protein